MADRVIVGDARRMDLSRFRQYQIILADPPWWYADQKKVRKDTKVPTRGIGACHHYDLMTTPELAAMPVAQLAAKRCLLFMWATAPKLHEALTVMDAWGFVYSTIGFVWVKLNPGIAADQDKLLITLQGEGLETLLDAVTFFGPGYYTGSNVELLLLGRKKKAPSIRHGRYKAPQVFYSPRLGHSEKPHEIQQQIAAMYSDAAPRLELFARHPFPGWDVFGNELGDGPEVRETAQPDKSRQLALWDDP